jgi:sRNA-binding protein
MNQISAKLLVFLGRISKEPLKEITMKKHLRLFAASSLVLFGLSAATVSAQQSTTATQTGTDTAAKKHHHKSKDTSATASASTATAAPAATSTAASTATAKTKAAFRPTANASAADIAAAKASGQVWVNTGSTSKAYHKSSSKYFGATKAGKFMTEADAQKAGYHLAKD